MLIKVHDGVEEQKNTKGETWLGVSLDSCQTAIQNALGSDKVITNARLCVAAHFTGGLGVAQIYVYAGWGTGASNINYEWINGNKLSTSRQEFYSSYRLSDIFSSTTYPYTINKKGCSYYTIYLKTANVTMRKHFIDDVYIDVEYINRYTVSVGAGVGGSISSTGGTYNAGSTFSVSATPAIGYTFAGWANSSGTITTTANPYSFAVNGNTTFNAVFNPITYYVVYDKNGGSGTIDAATVKYDANYTIANCTFTAPTITHTYNANGGSCSKSKETINKKFSIWQDDYTGIEYSEGQVVKNLYSEENDTAVLLAIWINPTITLPTATRDGYEFLGWIYNGTTYAAGAQLTPTSNATFTASWKQLKITEVYCGDGEVAVYVGDEEIGEIYVGNTKVYG